MNEVRAYNAYSKKFREIFYYGVSGTMEIDLVIQTQKKTASRPDKVINNGNKTWRNLEAAMDRLYDEFQK